MWIIIFITLVFIISAITGVYKGIKIAIVEAKKDELDVSEGVPQAKEYAERMNIRFTYSCNGDKIWAIDMQTGEEGFVNAFPTPQELWERLYPENNPLRDKLNAVPFNRDGGKSPRYYQEIAFSRRIGMSMERNACRASCSLPTAIFSRIRLAMILGNLTKMPCAALRRNPSPNQKACPRARASISAFSRR